MQSSQFKRQYRLKAGPEGFVGFEIGEEKPPHYKALHIQFSLERTDSNTLNTAKIFIWNLNQLQLNTLAMTNCIVELNAGYGERRPCIFRGTVSSVVTQLDGPNRCTEIEAIDGFAQVRDTYVSVCYSGRISAKTLIDDTANLMGLPVIYSKKAKSLASKVTLAKGFSYIGCGKNVLDSACKVATLVWSIQNGTLQVTRKNESISSSAQIISKKTGLIGVPKKIYNSAVAAGENTGSTLQDSLFGYEVVYLMNGAISVNDLVKLESEEVTGMFRVYKLEIHGDNTEGDWQCTAQLVEVGA